MKRGAALVAVLALSYPAGAAAKGLTAQLYMFPSRPHAGRLVMLQLRTFEGPWPLIVPANHRWHVAAVSARRSFAVHVVRSSANPYVWSARFRFPTRGLWDIDAGSTIIPTLEVNVRQRGSVGVWQRLERPLHTPTIPRGSPCRTSPATGDLSRIGFVGTAWGPGPAYPGGLGNDRPMLSFKYPPPPDSGWGDWGGNKILWMRDLAYFGPILVRGLQVDGPNELRFDDGPFPSRSLRFDFGNNLPSYTRVIAPGCYAYQVDGTSFSYTIVFEARISS
ncbi:MAG: hypothetical protein WBB74_12190 [Gaiellaceae bacterium]